MWVESLIYEILEFAPALSGEEAILKTGAGRTKEGRSLEWSGIAIKGVGQYRPLEGANPFIGEAGKVNQVEECRVEILCVSKHVAELAVEALLRTHPYESPAYELVPISKY